MKTKHPPRSATSGRRRHPGNERRISSNFASIHSIAGRIVESPNLWKTFINRYLVTRNPTIGMLTLSKVVLGRNQASPKAKVQQYDGPSRSHVCVSARREPPSPRSSRSNSEQEERYRSSRVRIVFRNRLKRYYDGPSRCTSVQPGRCPF